MIAIRVAEVSQVAEARRVASREAASLGFDEADTGRAAIVATELATNLLRHGGGGEMLLSAGNAVGGATLEITVLDKGGGMSDVEACLRDGYSTGGTAGTGLGAVTRQSNSFDIYSQPGGGTAVLARLRSRTQPPRLPVRVAVGGVCIAKMGETACGDDWSYTADADTCTLMLADGLGHGPLAAAASGLAVATFARNGGRDPVEITQAIHDALRVTRGAAVSVARLDFAAATATFCGIGNVAGTLVGNGGMRRMVSLNGTAGAAARRIQSFNYPLNRGSVAVLNSDGLLSSWSVDRYPGLLRRDPALIAAVLYRDFVRGRDDVMVVVAKEAL